MKKNLKIMILCSLLMIVIPISTMALDVDYSISPYDPEANQHDVCITINNEGGCLMAFTTKVTFNNEKLILADCENYEPIDLSASPLTSADPLYSPQIQSGRLHYSYLIQDYTWTTVGNKTTGLITLYVGNTTTAELFNQSALDICYVCFKLGEGITYNDILPEDFTVDYIYISDYNYGQFGYNEPTVSTPVAFTNNIANKKTATVSGEIASDSLWEATIKLIDISDNSVVFTTETIDGVYKLEAIPHGTYKFVATKNAHLSYTKDEFIVKGDVTKDVTITGGDINGDGIINFTDLSELILVYSKSNTDCDISGDGCVNFTDLSILIVNYNDKALAE